MTANQPDAVIFDFDGTIFDSETPIYRAYAAALAEVGLELTIPGWATVVGHGEEDSHRALVAAVGVEFDRDDVEARYRRQPRPFDSLPALPGVDALFAELIAADIPIGVASSSSESWVHTHLTRLGLREHVQVIALEHEVERVEVAVRADEAMLVVAQPPPGSTAPPDGGRAGTPRRSQPDESQERRRRSAKWRAPSHATPSGTTWSGPSGTM